VNPDRWQQIKQVFNDALQRERLQRAAFLAEACADDGDLRAEVEKLLAAYETDFMDQPAVGEVASTIVSARQQLRAGQRLGRYRIAKSIGAGGMGEVYLAHDTELERDVALKILTGEVAADQQRMQRFIQEAKTASALNHPNIITIHEVGQVEGLRFIATEYIKGETLRQRLRREPLSLRECFEVAVQVAAALATAHEAKIVHRDIKPENIMLRPDGLVKVLDFGLAKLTETNAAGLHDPNAATRLQINTAPGVVMGTFNYMSPEQARGKEVDLRTDIWSFGVVLYEMVTGHMPFTGDNSSDVIAAILKNEPKPLINYAPDAPAELQRITRKTLRKERDERYQTVKDLLLDLKSLQREVGSAAEMERSVAPLQATGQAKAATANQTAATSTPAQQAQTTSSAEYIVTEIKRHKKKLVFAVIVLVAAFIPLAFVAYKYLPRSQSGRQSPQRALARLTYDTGLQSEPTWSPDGRFIAYSSNRSGNLDIWVQPVSGGNPVQVTKSPAQDWEPDWSPEGSNLAFRSERDGGGIFVVPALGGNERRVAASGYRPRWSPDGNKILFFSSNIRMLTAPPKVYVVGLDGAPPQEVLPKFLAGFTGRWEIDWYPDGERLSIWGERLHEGRGFWTAPLDGGAPQRSEIGAEVEQERKAVGVDLRAFQWSPKKDAIFFEGVSRGVSNLWKIEVDAKTGAWRGGPERLTVGAGADVDVAISRDGSKIAFVTQTQVSSLWSVPFDPVAGKIKGAEQRITAPELNPGRSNLSRDGTKLVFVTERAGTYELRLHSFVDNTQRVLITTDKLQYMSLALSRDNSRVAVSVDRALGPEQSGFSHTSEHSIWSFSTTDGGGLQLTSFHQLQGWVWDWTADQTMVLGSSARPHTDHFGLYLFPLAAAPGAENQMRLVTERAGYEAYAGKFSPNEQWITFEGGNIADVGERRVYVISTTGGEWTLVSPEGDFSAGQHWSPDGKTIYFVTNRGGLRNLWGRRFDSIAGQPIGEPFRVTNYETLGRKMDGVSGVSAERFVTKMTETLGSIWVLDNVNR
jgi:serine/threonine protein kinase